VIRKAYKTEGIVIRRRNLGEADKLITLLSRDYGKITLLAKGIRRISSKKAPHLELFNLVEVYLIRSRSFNIITEAEAICSFPRLRKNLDLLAYSYKLLEEVDTLLPEDEPYPSVFSALYHLLFDLNQTYKPNLPMLVNNFTLQLMWELGYLPKGKTLKFDEINTLLEDIVEKRFKSDKLLTKLLK